MTLLALNKQMTIVDWLHFAFEYSLDRWQRAMLVSDVMRKRGNNYLDHIQDGQPPVLVFEYETILDGMYFDKPVNYALVKICERQQTLKDHRQLLRKSSNRQNISRRSSRISKNIPPRPIVVIDPRAGHGPGIGGSKLNSQIGVALDYGHPVYFIMFSPDPVPGQTIAAVQNAEIRFLEEVARRHRDAPKPAVIGNCQAGWAAALIGADRPDLVGPMVFNGSPLSYWGGVEGANPMRYKGGLSGGVWNTSFWSDLGHGEFDGAHLVAGFEDLNPANTYWTKQYHLFTHVDTEEQRYLEFEKWWGGFFKLGAKEIEFITSSLFVGNELEKGLVELQEGRPINLKNFKEPIFVFASCGDNITPPPQALNWIVKVYGSVAEIKRNGQIIIYMIHQNIGHLGIFVSGRVADKEHRQIIGCLDMVDYMAPGLYEMVITGDPTDPDIDDYAVQLEERDISDILAMDDGLEDENAFVPVAAVSKMNDALYRQWIQPWVQMFTTPWLAEGLRQLHPLRYQRYGCSDVNPLMWPIAGWAALIKENRRPAAPDNPFVVAESRLSDTIETSLNLYRDIRDRTQEWLFKAIYNNPWVNYWWGSQASKKSQDIDDTQNDLTRRQELAYARRHARQGGFVEAVIRIIIVVAGVDHTIHKRQYEAAEAIVRHHKQFSYQTPAGVKKIVRTQARILSANIDLALEGLADMLPNLEQRREAFEIAVTIAKADFYVGQQELGLLARIVKILSLEEKYSR